MSWQPAPRELTVAEYEVHVLAARLEVPEARIEAFATTLSEDERERAARFVFERDRRRFTVARGALRAILGRCLGVDPAAVPLRTAAKGKPEIGERSDLRFSVSHSEELALYALARGREVGIDVERLRPLPEAERIAERYFAPEERAALRAVPPDDRAAAFFRLWTRKEAYAKATGEGVFAGLAELVGTAGANPAGFTIVDLDLLPERGYIGALAVAGPLLRLVRRRFEPGGTRGVSPLEPGGDEGGVPP